jgi:hypothetical protein
MKHVFLSLIFCLVACHAQNQRPAIDRNYQFSNGVIPRNVLESYLSRSITQMDFLNFYGWGAYADKNDDTRMLLNIGAKFIGRALCTWSNYEIFNQPFFWTTAKSKIDEMHTQDADMIFQSGIFEIISTQVSQVSVPAWVFEAFNLPVEHRNFVYEDMLNQSAYGVNFWNKGASIPDISRQKTRMLFYFMSCIYMEAGIEAIHFGQVMLMAVDDQNNNFAAWSDLLG